MISSVTLATPDTGTLALNVTRPQRVVPCGRTSCVRREGTARVAPALCNGSAHARGLALICRAAQPSSLCGQAQSRWSR
jgi:hypothetical protein